jgi:hypothetical protein
VNVSVGVQGNTSVADMDCAEAVTAMTAELLSIQNSSRCETELRLCSTEMLSQSMEHYGENAPFLQCTNVGTRVLRGAPPARLGFNAPLP